MSESDVRVLRDAARLCRNAARKLDKAASYIEAGCFADQLICKTMIEATAAIDAARVRVH